MTSTQLVRDGLRFHWRSHAAVAAGAALATAVLVGALLVGDSVRFSLERLALLRLGGTELAVASPTRFFRAALADELPASLHATVAPALLLRGIVATADGKARANRVQIVGVDDRFWALGRKSNATAALADGTALINERLARQLGWKAGQAVVVRLEKPTWLPRDAPLASDKDLAVAARVTVTAVVSDEAMGRFSLQANQIPLPTLFVPLAWLQQQTEQPGRANVLLVGTSGITTEQANVALRQHWQLTDADLELRELTNQNVFELRSDRVFLDPPLAEAITRALPQAQRVMAYFVNELRDGSHTTPYSTVAAMSRPPSEIRDDELLLNSWLADDLAAKPGDTVALKYFVIGPGHVLEERSATFRVQGVVPLAGVAADSDLMPKFPGLHDRKDCGEWDPGIPVDLQRIRDKDRAYWQEHRGTPKAFITLKAGQQLWGNRYGNLTALRWPTTDTSRAAIEAAIHAAVAPASFGLFFQPVRAQALAASRASVDFGQLFLGFSFFLIISALLLMGLLFTFGIQQRTQEIGTLLALGLPGRLVRRILLGEGLALALVGGIVGTLGGLAYTQAALLGLATIWRGATGTAEMRFHAEPLSVVTGAGAGMIVSFLVIWFGVRRQAKLPARVLLAGGPPARLSRAGSRLGLWVAIGAALTAAVIVMATGAGKNAEAAFFGAGALVLIAGFGFSQTLLKQLGGAQRGENVGQLGLRNAARHGGRSLTTIGLLACGSFLIVAVGANRHDPHEHAALRASGTGGFALLGETTVALTQDLNQPKVREDFGLSSAGWNGVSFVPLRVHEGDDASCLNLNRAQSPRLLGVAPSSLAQRGAFAVAGGHAWPALEQAQSDGAVPAIGDEPTVTWALGKKVGDTIACVDERGQTFQVRIVGIVASSILQGSLVISEQNFLQRFPSESGYRMLLIDAPQLRASDVAAALTTALRDYGGEVRPAAERLAELNAVENTYLSIFQVIGGLGLLLGNAGLGIVVLRNVLERRRELALLRAVGFSRRLLHWLVLSEHWLLLVLGLGCGIGAALVAVLPSLRSPGADVPVGTLSMTLAAITASGFLWSWLAAKAALRGPLLQALRNE